MKTQLSQDSFRRAKRFSGVYQQQGRMLTDADWNELVDILKHRVREAMSDVIGSGSPGSGGLVNTVLGAEGLRWGRVYVDGIVAEVRSGPTATSAVNFGYDEQEDFPEPGVLPTVPYVLYADVWERPVTSLEDPVLRDPGLHGADTCTRTQTMAQVKWSTATDPDDRDLNPQCGDAVVNLTERTTTSAAAADDPCGQEVTLDDRSGNYLFRLEVHHVDGPANAPTRVVLKWSSENGAEQHAVGTEPVDFASGDWRYEYYDDTTEKHLGVHLDRADDFPQRNDLQDDLDSSRAAREPSYVRRWDGSCELAPAGGGGTVVGKHRGTDLAELSATAAEESAGVAAWKIDSGSLQLFIGTLKLELAFEGKRFVAGDYWLARVREHATAGERVRMAAVEPVGIIHHYLKLGAVDDGTFTAYTDAERRRHGFPPLTDLTARDVGYDSAGQEARWQDILDAEAALPLNVQDALDRLVAGIESSDIGYTLPGCPEGHSQTTLELLATVPDWPDLDADGHVTVKDVLHALLCHLDSGRIPYDTGDTDTIRAVLDQLRTDVDGRVLRSGDSMTGPLAIADSLYVTDRVGIGTDSPGAALGVIGDAEIFGAALVTGSLKIEGDCDIKGNLVVGGTTTTINAATLEVDDNIIRVNRYDAAPIPADVNGGLEVFRGGTAPNAQIIWDEAVDEWQIGVEGSLVAIARMDHVHSKLHNPAGATAMAVDSGGNVLVNAGLSVGGALQIGGATFRDMRQGTLLVGSSLVNVVDVFVSFGPAMAVDPLVLVTPRFRAARIGSSGVVACTVQGVTRSGFTARVRRVDSTGGWPDALHLDWIAWS